MPEGSGENLCLTGYSVPVRRACSSEVYFDLNFAGKKPFQYILISLVLILFMSVSWFRFYLFAGKSNQDHVKTHGSHPGYASGSGS